jgi:hypothetical protein
MGVKGYFLFRGDKTVCGGKILEGCTDHQFFDKDMACEGHKVTCGKHPGHYRICGGLEDDMVKGLPERYTAIAPAPASRSSFLQTGMMITSLAENQQ